MEQFAEAARDGPGILRESKVPFILDPIAISVHF